MQQRLAAEVEVDEGGHDADLGAAQPQPDVLRLVLHEERHAVAVAEPRGEEIVRQSVAVLVQLQQAGSAVPLHRLGEESIHCHLLEGPTFILKIQSDFIWVLFDSSLEDL